MNARPPGSKLDAGKLPWALMPWDALEGAVKVLAFGASKYGDRQWEGGMAWSRCYSALQRHMTAWWQYSEDGDPETGFSHLGHAMCCLLFLAAYEQRGVGLDDRPSALSNSSANKTSEEI